MCEWGPVYTHGKVCVHILPLTIHPLSARPETQDATLILRKLQPLDAELGSRLLYSCS